MAAAGMSIAVLGYAPAASAGLGVLTVGLILWINWGRPWWRKRRMRRPFAAYFGSGARSEWARVTRPGSCGNRYSALAGASASLYAA